MKKKHEDHVNHERWLVSYADFITLLFAFFVVMYAFAQSDKVTYERKLKEAAQSIRQAFDAPFFGPPGGTQSGAPGDLRSQAAAPGAAGGEAAAGSMTHSGVRDEVKAELEESLSLDLGVSNATDNVRVLNDPRGIVIRLALKDFFAPGRAEIARDLWPLLDRLGRVLVKHPRVVRVEGHADATEPLGAYPSAWELSAARASWVVRYWISRYKLNPQRIEAVGLGATRPLDRGEEDFAHARNRRIEIVLLK